MEHLDVFGVGLLLVRVRITHCSLVKIWFITQNELSFATDRYIENKGETLFIHPVSHVAEQFVRAYLWILEFCRSIKKQFFDDSYLRVVELGENGILEFCIHFWWLIHRFDANRLYDDNYTCTSLVASGTSIDLFIKQVQDDDIVI